MSNSWMASDELAAKLADTDLRLETCKSVTIELDKSQPPTPDGTGRPANFDVITSGVYRSSYPQEAHFDALADLDLKTIITFVNEPMSTAYASFISSNGITHHGIHVKANKDENVYTATEVVHEILDLMLNPENYPILIHCNKGKHRTGCMTACFRRVTGWSVDRAIDEYVKYATPKERELDKAFIRRFDPSVMKPLALERRLYGQMMLERQRGGADSSTNATESSMYTTYSYETDSSPELVAAVSKRLSLNEEMLASSKLWHYR